MDNRDLIRYWLYQEDEAYEERCIQRLQQELEINEAGIEVILRMRRQMRELQARLRQMEAEMAAHRARLAAQMQAAQQGWIEAYYYEIDERDDSSR